jgi:hypothetical protein
MLTAVAIEGVPGCEEFPSDHGVVSVYAEKQVSAKSLRSNGSTANA